MKKQLTTISGLFILCLTARSNAFISSFENESGAEQNIRHSMIQEINTYSKNARKPFGHAGQFESIGLIESANGICHGFRYKHSRLVVSAGHCAFPPNGGNGEKWPDRFDDSDTFFVQRMEKGQERRIKMQFITAGGPNPRQDPTVDYSVFLLDKDQYENADKANKFPPPLEPKYEMVTSDTQLYLGAYPTIEDDKTWLRESGTERFAYKEMNPNIFQIETNCSGNLNPQGLIRHYCSALKGASGTPLLSKELNQEGKETFFVRGIHIAGDDKRLVEPIHGNENHALPIRRVDETVKGVLLRLKSGASDKQIADEYSERRKKRSDEVRNIKPANWLLDEIFTNDLRALNSEQLQEL